MSDKKIEHRENYNIFKPITTRWMDNDVYGHVNNVTYYSYFDTAANSYLIEEGGLDIQNSPVIGYVVNSGCDYHSGIAYPDRIEAGLRVDRLGNSSVQYGIAIFKEGEDLPSANGHFVHVFVDRESGKPVAIPDSMREALEKITVAS
ncbi:thioesterase [Gammaproteobacteria bacterium 45_16_T64]|nr:thioesterase [Gammaproteobacteria bacterium 45_16_T64]